MDKTEFLVIFPTFERLDVVKQTLPSVIAEVERNDARLIVHDCSVQRDEKWAYLRELRQAHDFMLLLSDNMSMAHSRNLCLHLGQELYVPDYICLIEDDLGFHEGLIASTIAAIKKYYGQPAPNGLRFGMFTGSAHYHLDREVLPDGHAYPSIEALPGSLGGANSCFRCAPTSHWNNVLRSYDLDEYPISTFQTKNVNFRNYHRGFTTLIIDNGARTFEVDTVGRGATTVAKRLRLWDDDFTASDPRSCYLGKPGANSSSPRKSWVARVKRRLLRSRRLIRCKTVLRDWLLKLKKG